MSEQVMTKEESLARMRELQELVRNANGERIDNVWAWIIEFFEISMQLSIEKFEGK